MITFKEKKPVTDVIFLKTVQDPDIAVQKTSIVDVLCKDEDGNPYIVELQVAKEKGFEKRAHYYAAKAYSSQMKLEAHMFDLKRSSLLLLLILSCSPIRKPGSLIILFLIRTRTKMISKIFLSPFLNYLSLRKACMN